MANGKVNVNAKIKTLVAVDFMQHYLTHMLSTVLP